MVTAVDHNALSQQQRGTQGQPPGPLSTPMRALQPSCGSERLRERMGKKSERCATMMMSSFNGL